MTTDLLRRAALPLAVAGACLAIGFAVQAAEADADDESCTEAARGRFSDRCAADPRAREIDGVDPLPASSERELPRLTLILGDDRQPQVQRTERERTEPGAPVQRSEQHTPRFASGEDLLREEDRARLDAVVAQVRGRPGLRFEIVGHTDVQRIAPALRPRFPDNHALGLARARQVGRYLTQQLDLPESAFQAASQGPDQPVATPAAERANWPANRRVEVRVYWQEAAAPVVVKVVEEQRVDPTFCGTLLRPEAADVPLRITLDGEPLDGNGMSSADRQRCVDVSLERDHLRLQYDNLSAPRRLNATAWPAPVVPGETVQFAGYSNYRLFLARAELRIFRANSALQPQLLDTVPLDGSLRAQWQAPADLLQAGLQAAPRLFYRLRVYDRSGRFDETDDIPLTLAERRAPAAEAEPTPEQRLLAAYGESRLAVTNIPVRGGTVTASGEGIRQDQRVRALGFDVPVDLHGKFALQQIVPRQLSTGEIAVIDPDGREQVYRRDFELPKQDFFLVGQADLTLGRDHTSGPAALVTGDKNRYQNDVWSEGRIAFYGKGALDERWNLTASVDTEERALKDLLKNLDRKDPTSLFRRIDPVDSWGTFGDDSTTVEDAPTQGRMYLRVDDGRSHVMWGNYKLTLGQETTLAQVNRGLYGLHGRYVGDEATAYGDARLRVDLYAAEPGTLAAREEFRGTGGSLYYLRHQDLSRGAEKAYVEIRDRDSGLVLQRRSLIPGTDYEMDYLQGRLLLTSPLTSTADAGALLASVGGYAGQPVYLVVDYEYAPLTSLDTLAAGGRVAWWANDHVRLGVSASRQQQTGGDQRLAGVDLTLRKTELSYLKVEAARSEGPGTMTLQSLDGGFSFGGAVLPDSTVGANAWRVEGQAELRDFELASGGRVAAYAQQRGAGFSAPGQLATNETRQAGGTATLALDERTDLRLKADHKDEVHGYNTDAAEAQLSRRLDEHWTVSAGARLDRKSTDTLNTSPLLPTVGVVEGERTDAVLKADYASGEGWGLYGFGQKTLNATGTRLDNDRLGLGGRYQLNERLGLRAEASGGNGGGAGRAGVDYKLDDRSNLYMTYVRDTGRTDETLAARGGVLVGGVKSRVSDTLSVYSEQRQTTGVQAGLVSAYGLQWAPDERWTLGATAEKGRLEVENAGELRREALGFTVGYVREGLRYAGGAETRRDATALETRRSWLLKNAFTLKNGTDGRWLGKLNWADSDSSTGAVAGAKYTEAVLGYAWRPVANDRLNVLAKYTWLNDLSSPGQLAASSATATGTTGAVTSIGTLPVATGYGVDYQQRSQVIAVDLTYDLTARWSVGGKLARRVGELRPSRDDSAAWFKSTADLAIVRVDWKVVRQWDWLVELRTLRAAELSERKSGFLTAGYYHVNENLKVGLGYNFTDFSDNLTDLGYRSRGVFLNVLGKF